MASIGSGMYEDDRAVDIKGFGPHDPNPENKIAYAQWESGEVVGGSETTIIPWTNPLSWLLAPIGILQSMRIRTVRR